MTVNELIEELTALREHHRCGDFEVMGVVREWNACECLHPKDYAKSDNYDFNPSAFVRPRITRQGGFGNRVVELAPEPVNG